MLVFYEKLLKKVDRTSLIFFIKKNYYKNLLSYYICILINIWVDDSQI